MRENGCCTDNPLVSISPVLLDNEDFRKKYGLSLTQTYKDLLYLKDPFRVLFEVQFDPGCLTFLV